MRDQGSGTKVGSIGKCGYRNVSTTFTGSRYRANVLYTFEPAGAKEKRQNFLPYLTVILKKKLFSPHFPIDPKSCGERA